jgi:hypothetical protein
MELIFTTIIPIAIIATGIFFSFWRNAIKDISTQEKKPYSFSRTQMMWWTIIILSCFSAFFGCNGKIPELENYLNVLALLGIGSGTFALGNLIDKSDIDEGKVRQQDRVSKGFLMDILDDGHGISIHRFQALLFNVIFGLIFINNFYLNRNAFPNFTEFELSLLGISSATYLALKAKENTSNPKPDVVPPVAPPGNSKTTKD